MNKKLTIEKMSIPDAYKLKPRKIIQIENLCLEIKDSSNYSYLFINGTPILRDNYCCCSSYADGYLKGKKERKM